MKTPTSKPAKLALCLQVCPLDVWSGLRLTQLICSIEPAKRADVDFIVSSRRDTNRHAVEDIASKASDKFSNVRIISGKRFGTGWPSGCNDLWQETMLRVSQMHERGHITATGILTFESDCIPLRPDWIDKLAVEWKRAQAEEKFVCGHAHSWGESAGEGTAEAEPTHINGNAIFQANVTDVYPDLNGCESRQGWDAYHGSLLLRIGTDTPFIYQRYRLKDGLDAVRGQPIDRAYVEAIRKDGQTPAIFHGIKGDFGMKVIEAMIADRSFFSRV